MSLTISDLERLQTKLKDDNLDYQLELIDGSIIVMGPSDYTSDEIGSRLIIFLGPWVLARKLGRVTGAAAGFRLPNDNQDLRAPDVSFVSAERLKHSPRAFAEVVPDLMVEIKSKTDRIKPIQEKIQFFLSLGTRVGILIDPDKETVTIYRPTGEATILTNNDILTIPELFPGWEIPVSELWPPEFE
ncbi:Uma2 family endonuclease [Limnofasciculus baicalensis]|uniref:Uma2 family endonuclease n=1 Tax=Limnofasciculus baicalensis BBK-W-15 TaxID=2699891 RepID=A0AAE3GRZ1_9CYAN|nr:Uma2 family endonuclease [Limnofasciculus baicalensis]MCP2728768.1 Uma2 family endonuclease [Limnofasciculus baicalensis BBK-W-15]MCP2728769.1 Uma2 family endonuclease [Limnofasciculus baicalensis BBK-W-15]